MKKTKSMSKKRILAVFIALVMGLSLAGCKSSGEAAGTAPGTEAEESGKAVTETGSEETGETPGTDSVDTAKPDGGEKAEAAAGFNGLLNNGEENSAGLPETEEELLSLLTGKWGFADKTGGTDYASLDIEKDGAVKFTRKSDGLSCEGKLSFERMYAAQNEAPDFFRISFENIPEGFQSGEMSYSLPDDKDETSGLYYIGNAAGEDFLFLEEIGNGDTFISNVLFMNEAIGGPAKSGFSPSWVLHRESIRDNDMKPRENADFYAWLWKKDKNGSMWLQEMTPETRDANEDYTDRHYTAAFFNEEKLEAVSYEAAASLDTSSMLNERLLNNFVYPLIMCKVKTNEKGAISELNEVDTYFYGIYDLGSLKPEISYEGMKFIYNGVEMELPEDDEVSNAIMDCKEMGDWVIVETHINPHMGAYHFFNTYSGDFEHSIYGTNLIWQGSDITTAVYADHSEIRDFQGDYIGSVTEGEIYNLAFSADGKSVEAECWKIENDNEVEFKESFEIPERRDDAMFFYEDYLRREIPSKWKAFIEMAPENAGFFVMTNPPEHIMSKIFRVEGEENKDLEKVVIVSLSDNTHFRIVAGEPAYENDKYTGWKADKTETDFYLDKGEAVRIDTTIPEGVPSRAVIAETDSGKEYCWPVFELSGETLQHSEFITED